jgi:hypothetical protein
VTIQHHQKPKSPMDTRRYVLLTLTVCMLATCIGCKTVEVSYDPGVAPAPTLPCPVALSLSKEFTTYEGVNSDKVLAGEVVHAPFGPALQKYATYVAQSVFGDVQVLDGQPLRSDAKLLLVPRVTNSRLEPPVGNVRITAGNLGVHWDFNDPKTGQTLFSMLIESESSQSHIRFDARFSAVCEGLMTNLTSLTIQRFNASKEIQRLSGH